jgi:uncharacterized membrane protein
MEKETGRLEAFSDGVFAIAITLLILEIRVPVLQVINDRSMLAALAGLWPSFLTFALSFFVVLIIWINHHELFRMVQGVDRPLLFANGALLLMVTFVPFPTALLARYIGTPAAKTAVTFYCATFFVTSLCHSALLESIAHNRRRLRADISNEQVAHLRRAYRFGLLMYLICTLVAIWNPMFGLLITVVLWVVWATLRYDSFGRH